MKIKLLGNIKLNKLFLLLLLAITTTSLNLSLYIGAIFLLVTIVILFLPVLLKLEEPINLIDYTEEKLDELFSLSKQKIEKANNLRIQQQEQQREQALQRELAEKEQIVALATANIPLEDREQIFKTLESLAIPEKETLLMALAGRLVSQGQVQVILNNIEKSERELITSTLSTLKSDGTYNQPSISSQPSMPVETVDSPSSTTPPMFEMKKKGNWINWVIFISGAIVIFFIVTILAEMGFPIIATGGVGAGLAIIFLIDAIYFLPTLIYHASTGGKIMMFILNSLFGFTIIGWIILLIIATSRNSKERRAQELMHYVKHK